MRPVMRYHGGKWQLAPWIISHFPEHRIYVEPFGGAASVLLRKPRSYAEVYNDLADNVVNVFRVLRDRTMAKELRDLLYLTPFSRTDFNDTYTSDATDPVERARQTIYRSMAGFGSAAATRGYRTGFRSNSNRSGTTPAHDWAHYPEHIPAFVERLRGVIIENRNALEVMQMHDTTETLHYCDPPYVHSTRTKVGWQKPYVHELTDDDHGRLAECIKGLSGMVIISGYDCGLYHDLFDDWRKDKKEARADGARKRTEVLWLSPNIPETQGRLFAGGVR